MTSSNLPVASLPKDPPSRLNDAISFRLIVAVIALQCMSLGFTPSARAAEATAITEALSDVTLSAPVAGIITSNHVREGQFVTAGQLAIELDKRLEELECTRRQVLAETKKKDFETTQVLFRSSKSISKEELEKKEMEYRVASVEYEAALEQLKRRSVITPLSGNITEILLDPGEACQPYQPILRIVDTRQCYLVLNLESSQGYGLKLNDVLEANIQNGGQVVHVEAKVTFISPVIDAASGLLKVKALFDNAAGQVRPGLAARVLLPP